MKLLLSGGHLTPALAFIDYLQEQHPEVALVFAGRLYSKKGKAQESQEKTEVEARGIPFISFDSGKMSASNVFEVLQQSAQVLTGIVRALGIMIKTRPTVFVSFGSYVAVPLGIAAWMCRIPVITHEQTETVGMANKILSYFAKHIAVSTENSARFFPTKKVVITGNLLRKQVLQVNNTPPDWFTTKSTKPILYITGGSQGSELINTMVSITLKQLLKSWVVVHQCGKPTKNRHYKRELERVRGQVPVSVRSHYYVREWINAKELAWIYTNAKCAVSRAGANTTHELAARNIPTLFIPLPFAHHDEQLANAKALADQQAALILLQKQASPETFLEALAKLSKQHGSIRRQLEQLQAPQTAVKKLFDLLVTVH